MQTFLMMLSFFAASPALASATDCSISPHVFQENLTKTFNDFDQNMVGGWRSLAQKGCYLAAGTFIDSYHLHHISGLADWQSRILYWHAGQTYAFQNIYSVAVPRFEKSINPDELPSDTFKWNAYVQASIAFLNGDLKMLKEKQAELATATDPNAKNNQRIVDNFVKCFGKSSYAQAYNANGLCN